MPQSLTGSCLVSEGTRTKQFKSVISLRSYGKARKNFLAEVLGANNRIEDCRSPTGLLSTPLRLKERNLLGGPVVKTSPFNAGGVGSIRGGGAKIAHAHGSSQRTKT